MLTCRAQGTTGLPKTSLGGVGMRFRHTVWQTTLVLQRHILLPGLSPLCLELISLNKLTELHGDTHFFGFDLGPSGKERMCVCARQACLSKPQGWVMDKAGCGPALPAFKKASAASAGSTKSGRIDWCRRGWDRKGVLLPHFLPSFTPQLVEPQGSFALMRSSPELPCTGRPRSPIASLTELGRPTAAAAAVPQSCLRGP